MSELEKYFGPYRENIIGSDLEHTFRDGKKSILYADWTASGRLYRPIENYISSTLGPYVANTHTETSLTGTMMTDAYHQAQDIIKKHVNASSNDAILFAGFGMTAVINKFQRILGLKFPEQFKNQIQIDDKDRPLVIITHMEHHSNHTSWNECITDVEIIARNVQGLPCLESLREILKKNSQRKLIIGSFTACSNVTGIETPIYEMAEIMHEFGGYCFADFAASAPYVKIDMHPENEKQKLDAVLFSPHKFLGGPGSSGIIVFDKTLYRNQVPDSPGGGTVMWTNPWGEQRYFEDVEVREDGGTPGFLQAIRSALSILLKEEMTVEKILKREHELKDRLIKGLQQIPGLNLLEGHVKDRLGIVSFYTMDKHFNLIVKILNDKFGVQTRGGCSCAGTYGHILLDVDHRRSQEITKKIEAGDLTEKPGWVRVSVHPTFRDEDVDKLIEAVSETFKNYDAWSKDYVFHCESGEFTHRLGRNPQDQITLRTSFQPTGLNLNQNDLLTSQASKASGGVGRFFSGLFQ